MVIIVWTDSSSFGVHERSLGSGEASGILRSRY